MSESIRSNEYYVSTNAKIIDNKYIEINGIKNKINYISYINNDLLLYLDSNDIFAINNSNRLSNEKIYALLKKENILFGIMHYYKEYIKWK